MNNIPDIETTPEPDQSSIKYAVMIVDDSAFIRGAIARAIESDPNLVIISSVSNGEQAVKSLGRSPVDVIVLDIEMPVMDGLTALPKLKEIDPAVQVIMASTLTQKNAEISLKAMSLGATDYIPKPSSGHAVSNADDFQRDLVGKVKALGALARRTGVRPVHFAQEEVQEKPTTTASAQSAPKQEPKPEAKPSLKPSPAKPPLAVVPDTRPSAPFVPPTGQDIVLRKGPVPVPDVLAIGSSTGGPQALFQVIKDMGKDLPQPIVITQHMPPSFTAILAEHITKQCNVECKEAVDGDVLQPGHYYIAPGDYHMTFEGNAKALVVKLTKDPPENFCRPAVDPMLRSLASIVKNKLLVTILTGMGADGTTGCQKVIEVGGAVVAQDEATSVVWGMPGSVAVSGLCSKVLPVTEIGAFVRTNALRLRS